MSDNTNYQSLDLMKFNIKNNSTKKYSELGITNILKQSGIDFNKDDIEVIKIRLEKLNYIYTLLVGIIYDGTLQGDEPYINKLVQEINTIMDQKISKKECFNMLKTLIKNKKHLDLFVTNEDGVKELPQEYQKFIINLKGKLHQHGGEDEDIDSEQLRNWEPSFLGKIYGWGPDVGTITKSIDIFDSIIDIAGFIPGAGIVVDAAGVLVSLLRGRFLDAFFSVINIIPVIGSFIGTPSKYITKYIRYKKKYDKLVRMKEMLDSDEDDD